MDVTSLENEIFLKLETLCSSPGYLHAIAYFCFRDNVIKYTDTMTAENLLHQFSKQRLCRTEISTLIGLACKSALDVSQPTASALQTYVDETEKLLAELHNSMLAPVTEMFAKDLAEAAGHNPFESGSVLRESIFYGAEGAYSFQYRDISSVKYRNDDEWFINNKGFSVDQANFLISAIESLQEEKLSETIQKLSKLSPDEWTVLPCFTFTPEEISERSNINIETTKSFIEAFTLPTDQIKSFKAIDDFNAHNAFPIIKISEGAYISFQSYSLSEAIYETPFFWLNHDKDYANTARKHRGDFTENFSADRLKLVFGESNVYTNIDIYKNKTVFGEIDVLIVFADRAIILQAKSKKLTIAARKGNDNLLRDDFKKAIQDANDQAFLCAELLLDTEYQLRDINKNDVPIPREFKEIYPICVISEHYPALSFQARQFLSYKSTKEIKAPMVMDVFLLDVMTELLQSPLYFLSYINKRAQYGEKVLSNHELVILALHLKQNLWIEKDVSMMYVDDDVSSDLDIAMLSRRNGAPGEKTPDGILKKYKGTAFDNIISDIEDLKISDSLDLGFLLLELSGETIEKINDSISELQKLFNSDGKHHDITFGLTEHFTGITIHCNNLPLEEAKKKLITLCTMRKYKEKANSWFGICINPANARIRFGFSITEDWAQSDELDKITRNLKKPQHLKNNQAINFKTVFSRGKKIGRNEICDCGSGKKYKHCHGS